jgi:Spy/CpxP family protein refolding chaperone
MMSPSSIGRGSRRFSRLAAVLFVLVFARGAWAQPFAWWKNDQFRADLGLTADQSTRIDGVFQSTLPLLRQQKAELDAVEAKLSMLVEADADESKVSPTIDRAESARSSLSKTRTLMLLRMRQILTPEQRTRFKALHDRWLDDLRGQRAQRRPT